MRERKRAVSERRTRFFNRKSSSAFLSQKLYMFIVEIIGNTDEQHEETKYNSDLTSWR